MNFLCICLAPAIDATVRLNAWPTDGCIIKNAADTFAPGGKAVNVARWLAVRRRETRRIRSRGVLAPECPDGVCSVACGGFLGEDNAAMFEKELKRYGIEDRFVRVAGATRVNEMFVTPQGSFKVNRAASGGPVRTWEELAFRREGAPETFGARPRAPIAEVAAPETFGARPRAPIAEVAAPETFGARPRAPEPDVVILSGSLPQDWPVDTYRSLVEAAKKAGAKVVLDASGKALVEGVKAHPDVIKPNADECEALIGFVPKTPDDFKRATAALKQFCDYPIISDGGAGCWFDGEFVAAPKVEVLDTTAAGDTLLAEWCWRRFGGLEGLGCLGAGRWAVAAGSAACTMPGGEPPPVELVSRLASRVSRLASSPRPSTIFSTSASPLA